MKFAALILSTLIYLPSAFAGDATLFKKLIDVQRDSNGKITKVVYRKTKTTSAASQSLLIENLRSSLSALSAMSSELPSDTQLSAAGWTKEDIKNFKSASAKVKDRTEMLKALNNKNVGDILKFFENALNGLYAFHVLAAPGIPSYFFDRRLIDKAMDEAMGLVDNAIGEVPALNVIQYLLDMTLGLMVEKRGYGQQLVLYFLNQFSPAELGLTEEEAAFILSSLYEPSIEWYDFNAMKKAEKNWDHFGSDLFDKTIAGGEKRLNKYRGDFDSVGANYSFAFAPGSKKGVDYVLNLLDKKSKFQGELSIAYDYSNPKKIKNFRTEMQLVHFGLQFVPMPGFIRRQLSSLINSYFRNQKTTEGGLYAHFVATGKPVEAKVMLEQTNNVFLSQEW